MRLTETHKTVLEWILVITIAIIGGPFFAQALVGFGIGINSTIGENCIQVP